MEPKVKFKGGGSFVKKQPQFSADGQTLFLAWRNVIVSYSTKTAKRLKELYGLQDPVVGFSVHHVEGQERVAACSSTGEIIVWNSDLGFRLLKTAISQPDVVVQSFNLITSIYDDNKNNIRFLLTWTTQQTRNDIEVGSFHLLTHKWQPFDLRLNNKKYEIAVSRGRNPYFAVVQGRNLYFVTLTHPVETFCYKTDRDKFFTCVACHPDGQCVITGDSLGRVTMWHNLTSNGPSRAVFHWHTLSVKCLSFSSSGTNFFSGAGECVLVKWHIDDPHHKKFLPRLPSTLEHITVSSENQYVAVATADNAVRILDSKFDTVSVVQHLVLGQHFPAGIVYDQRSRSMALNGLTGHVQFYSPYDKTLLYNLDIVNQNKLTQERDCHIENTNVTKIAMDSQGLWLATVEERVDVSFSFELRLKFWIFNTVKQIFELNTSIELPHEKSITHILFQPSLGEESRCVTVGNDKKFKVWQFIKTDKEHGGVWNCSRVAFYRDMPCNALAFSSDGSLVAVGFGPIATTWLPDSCELKCSLLHPSYRQRLIALQFGTANECHLLVAATEEHLSIWNLLSLSMLWTVQLQVSMLVGGAMFSHMAVFTTDRLYIFHPGSSSPVYTQKLYQKKGNVVAAVFVPTASSSDTNLSWYQNSQLFFINSKQELYCVDADEDHYNESQDLLNEDSSRSLYTSMLAKHRSTTSHIDAPVQHLTSMSSNKQLKKLLGAPVHTMVPVRLTCASVLRSLIPEYKSRIV